MRTRGHEPNFLSQDHIIEFYKEEFLKHKNRLQVQREFYSDHAFQEIESALDKIINEIDTICQMDHFNELASHLLERIDVITNLSASPSNHSKKLH
ncbi:MAG: hypothetical protein AB1898_15590 [Acidobacteriota bacterium]